MLPEALASTFYSLQLTNRPPLPFDPWPELPRWSLGNGVFLIDDSSVDYESMQENPLSPPAPGSGSTVGNSQDWASNVRAPQAGGTATINLGYVGSRLINALVRNGFLYTCHHVGLSETKGVYFGNETGTNVTRSGVQWFKFRLESSGSLSYYKHDRIYDSAVTNALYYYFPSIAVNCASDILLGFSGSSSNTHTSAYYVWRPAVGLGSDPPGLFYEGAGYFGSDRWGDYSFTTVDPTDSLTFWTVQQHATGSELVWETRIGKVKRAY